MARNVLADARCRARLDAMLGRICTERQEVLPEAKVESLLTRLGPRQQLQRGGLAGRRQEKELIVFARLGGDEVFPGYAWNELRNAQREHSESGVLCQTAVEIQSVVGCPFDCTYCPYNAFVCVRLDVEAFVDRVTDLARQRRTQALYKLNNRSDTLGLEPEYGIARALIHRFAELDDKYLLLYTKGDGVEHLLDADHRGKTVVSFTLTPDPVAALLEPGAPPPAARIRAMGQLARAGYPVRVRFSPIVPIRGWRRAYEDLISRLAATVQPEMATFWTLSMIAFDELERIVPLDVLDDEAVDQARGAAPQMRGQKGAPFPPGLRATLYRHIAELTHAHSPRTHVALCLETPEVWAQVEALAPPCQGDAFLCNCGPRAVPAQSRHSPPRARRKSEIRGRTRGGSKR